MPSHDTTIMVRNEGQRDAWVRVEAVQGYSGVRVEGGVEVRSGRTSNRTTWIRGRR
jgi:hypothetical protein